MQILQNGTLMMLMATKRREVMQYSLDEPWMIASAILAGTFDVSAQTHQERGLSFSTD
ncbi:MAG: hypothetical protein ACOCYD_01905 [bacterium]